MSNKKPSIIRYTNDSSENGEGLFNLDFMTEGEGDGFTLDSPNEVVVEQPKRKRGRPRKNKEADPIIIESPQEQKPLPMCQSNEPYIDTYEDTNKMLKTAIDEIDCMNLCVAKDLDTIRSSKTLKNKYNHISDLTGISSSLINTKITAIRELNKTKTDSHNLELKRMKDITASQALTESDDNKYIMDLYNAFVQTPMGNNSGFLPNQMNFQSGDAMGIPIHTGGGQISGGMSDLTPAQNRMRLDITNPNVKVVVVYNTTTGEKYFDAMDTSTGERIPNYPLPSTMFLADTVPYVNEGIARNVNLDQTYPLIVVNNSNIGIY